MKRLATATYGARFEFILFHRYSFSLILTTMNFQVYASDIFASKFHDDVSNDMAGLQFRKKVNCNF